MTAMVAVGLHAAVYYMTPLDKFVRPKLELSDAAPALEAELVAGEEAPTEPVAAAPATAPQPPPVHQTPTPVEPMPPEPAPELVQERVAIRRPPPPAPKIQRQIQSPAVAVKPLAAKAARPSAVAGSTANGGATGRGISGGRGAGSSKPTPIERVDPPKATALEVGRTRRTVLVTLTVDVTGRATRVSVAASCGIPRLDRDAVEAVRRWRFKPGTRNGLPVAMRSEVDINYDPPG